MRQKSRFSIIAAVLVVAGCASTPQPTTRDVAAQWQAQVTAISAGDDTAERGQAIKNHLSSLGLLAREETFTSGKFKGTNIFADVGGPTGTPLLLIGAHYDRVDVGRGATDNASGSAAVLELASAFKSRPLKNHRVVVVFWDLEERGLLGSRAYVSNAESEKPAMYVNFDVFGWGDTLWMMRPANERWLDAETTAAAKANDFQLSAGEMYPPTDHLAFLKAGWPAVSYSLTDKDEIAGVLAAYQNLEKDPKSQPKMPKIMQVIHSERDTVDALDPATIPRALRTVEDALRAWDASNPK